MNINNMITIYGRLVRDPELKTSTSGTEYCNFTVAVDSYNGKEKETDFFDCTAFGKKAAAISKFFDKGKEIRVVGSMRSKKTEKDGVKRTFWNITVDDFGFCGGRNDGSGTPAQTDAESGMEVVETDQLPF